MLLDHEIVDRLKINIRICSFFALIPPKMSRMWFLVRRKLNALVTGFVTLSIVLVTVTALHNQLWELDSVRIQEFIEDSGRRIHSIMSVRRSLLGRGGGFGLHCPHAGSMDAG